ncbi:MAG: hypothetical protein U0X91_14840 [Spirosomataceae bacterium]
MKYLFLSLFALSLSEVWAQKLDVKPPKKMLSARSTIPLNTYRLSENSDAVYAQTDNMPILLTQAPEAMPNMPLKMSQDTAGVYRMPNPLRREARPYSPKP